ncbi:LytTR family DNA-binding domain-containing protein [Mucilaginibacter sp. BJC16-A38]|uniref:LytR/AlgR family response regulator transcription factor n=1 Tax=Mucilaginibacter phenanthrenivorans TaxID=1234842 RepID=UPI0021587DBA|nr:LytTR family DNA-binding domain-containing protein [Mucilaginibacter phenanthrenivorans]MCR8559169.1 LytTR family DNA-binding domain-containing protein [Mucilaginibacter phenanthrenivorans]
MKLRCLIIDDKPLAIDILADYTRKVPFLELVATTTNPIEGLNIVREQNIDLVFLDIQMPELTGIQFIKISGKQCKIVLTTAYTEYALDGYEHDVVDYLLKPIAFERFYRAAEKAFNLIAIQPNSNIKAAPIVVTEKPAEYLFVKTEHRIQKINLVDILYIEALQNYVSLNTTAGRVMSLQPLKKIEEQLPAVEFIRVHKSYIISLRHISSVERSRIFIGDTIIPVGDSYRDGFYKVIEKS